MFIFDIEIANPIPPENGQLVPGIKYSRGWNYPATMDIACICVYDYVTDTYRVFGEFELEDFQSFIDRQDISVGFNNIRFDNTVLRACDIKISDSNSYDILAEIYNALKSRPKGCKLENVIKANFSTPPTKTIDPAEAPILWQRGHHTKVIDYCLNDVKMTKMIFDKIIRSGSIRNPINPEQSLKLKRP